MNLLMMNHTGDPQQSGIYKSIYRQVSLEDITNVCHFAEKYVTTNRHIYSQLRVTKGCLIIKLNSDDDLSTKIVNEGKISMA